MVRRKGRSSAFALRELVVIILIVVTVSAFWVVLSRVRKGGFPRPPNCMNNLRQIGAAIATYSTQMGYRPYFGTGGGRESSSSMESLALLYPAYIDNYDTFRCYETEDRSAAVSLEEGTSSRHFAFGTASPTWSSYGYDPETSPRISSFVDAIAADMDGSWALKGRPRTSNHPNGQFVLYSDGHAEWVVTNFASSSRQDNIFTRTKGVTSPDTDAYIRRD